MFPSLLLKVLPYAAAAAAGAFLMHYLDGVRLAHLQAQYSAYQAQVAQAEAASQKAATDALQAQIAAKADAETRNQAIIEGLHHEVLSVTAAHSGAERLLASACKANSTPGDHQVPASADKPGTPEASDPSVARRFTAALANATIEAGNCIEQLSALQKELIPQLRTN